MRNLYRYKVLRDKVKKAAYDKQYIQDNYEHRQEVRRAYDSRSDIKKRRLDRQKVRRTEFREALAFLSGDVCPVCDGYMSAPEFHHYDDNKCYNISRMDGLKIEHVYEELDKTEVMCKACHTRTSWSKYVK